MSNNQEATYIDHMGTDLRVTEAARVSFAKLGGVMIEASEENCYPGVVYQLGHKIIAESDAKLIKYLATHGHWTPFAHPQITLRMKAPIPIRTQCFKHKQGFVENEESRRYISSTPEYYMPTFRSAVKHKKQGSGKKLTAINQGIEQGIYGVHMENSIRMYEDALARGICEEQARFYLPQGMMVNWVWTGSLAAFARFAKQRKHSHAQGEVRDLALLVDKIIQPLFPVSWEALTKG